MEAFQKEWSPTVTVELPRPQATLAPKRKVAKMSPISSACKAFGICCSSPAPGAGSLGEKERVGPRLRRFIPLPCWPQHDFRCRNCAFVAPRHFSVPYFPLAELVLAVAARSGPPSLSSLLEIPGITTWAPLMFRRTEMKLLLLLLLLFLFFSVCAQSHPACCPIFFLLFELLSLDLGRLEAAGLDKRTSVSPTDVCCRMVRCTAQVQREPRSLPASC